MRHLIAGATGALGTEICRRLTERGETVRGLVRTSSQSERTDLLKQLGVELAVGDLRDPGSLRKALDGVDVVVSTITTIRSRQDGDSFADSDERGHAALIDAANDAGVRRFVYISVSSNIIGDDGLTRSKRATEQRLRDSGLRYSILRPSFFMEVWLGPPALDLNAGRVVLFGSGDEPVSWISAGDVAEFAVRAALSDGPSEALDLGGPEAVSRREVVRLLERETGRTFDTHQIPLEVLERNVREATDEVPKTYATLQLAAGRGDHIDNSAALSRYHVELTSIDDYIKRISGA